MSIQLYAPQVSTLVTVVDNNSDDQTVAMVRRKFPKVNLIANQENLGFAKANNQAIEQINSEYTLLLNPDTQFLDNSLQKMLVKMDQKPEIMVLGPKLLNTDHTLQPSVRRFPNFWNQALVVSKLHRVWSGWSSYQSYLATDFDYQKSSEADQLMGACLLIRQTVFTKVGLLDDKIHLWFDEVDFCWRLKKANLLIWYYSEAKLLHHQGKSFAQVKVLKKHFIYLNSLFYYFKKHFSLLKAIGLLVLGLTIGLVFSLIFSLYLTLSRLGGILKSV